jgi:hypothetical protein
MQVAGMDADRMKVDPYSSSTLVARQPSSIEVDIINESAKKRAEAAAIAKKKKEVLDAKTKAETTKLVNSLLVNSSKTPNAFDEMQNKSRKIHTDISPISAVYIAQSKGFKPSKPVTTDAIANAEAPAAIKYLDTMGLFPDGTQKFAKGTNSAIGGMSLVGERGPEIVNLPKGAQVIPNHKLPDTLSSFANGTPNAERLINQIQSEGINNGIPLQARLSDILDSANSKDIIGTNTITPNAPQTLNTKQLQTSMESNNQLLRDLNTNLKTYLQNTNNQTQNINLIVGGRQLSNIQYKREQDRMGMKPNDLV